MPAAQIGEAENQAAAHFRKEIQPILVEYCYDSHGDGMNNGKVALDQFKRQTGAKTAGRLEWERFAGAGTVIARVPGRDSGNMLIEPNVAAVADCLVAWLRDADAAAPAEPRPA